ncbi:MAG: branched-chain amino acid ABC transporter permease [Chloroflexota bacterium]
MDVSLNGQLLAQGLAFGSIYALVALGFVLIYQAVGVVNFAQGEMVMVPAFLSVTALAVLRLPFIIGYGLTLAATAAFGWLFERIAYHPLRGRPFLPVVISTIGASILLQNGAQVIYGATPYDLPKLFPPGQVLSIGEVRVQPQYLLILLVTIVLLGFQYWLFERTLLGKKLMATAQDKEAARLMGIRTDRMVVITFVYSAILGGIAALLLGPIFQVSKTIGGAIALKAFSASVVGGFGSIPGAIVGGLLLGIVESFGAFYLRDFIPSAAKDAFAFIILVAVLLVRPEGLFGERVSEKA